MPRFLINAPSTSYTLPPSNQIPPLVLSSLILLGHQGPCAWSVGVFFETILKPSQGLLILDAAVGLEALEDVEMLEFKNGPFFEDKILV